MINPYKYALIIIILAIASVCMGWGRYHLNDCWEGFSAVMFGISLLSGTLIVVINAFLDKE